MTRHMETRNAAMHWVFPLEGNPRPWEWAIHVRMVRPYTRWLFEFMASPFAALDDPGLKPTKEELLQTIKKSLGDDTVGVEITHMGHWQMSTGMATHYSEGANMQVTSGHQCGISQLTRSQPLSR